VARYAYRNGGLNLVRPQLFSASDAKAASDALRLASEARLVNLHPDEIGESAKVIVVSASVEARDVSSLAAPDIEEAVRPIFRDHEVQFVPFDELAEFAKRVEAEAHG
jgi:hypothetical protein